MKVETTIHEQDFVAYQLYTASKAKSIQRKQQQSRIWITLGSMALGVYFYFTENIFLAVYFGLFTIITVMFYPMYFKWRHKKHYEKYIRENYQPRFGEHSTLEFTETELLSKDKTGESRMKLSEIEVVNEISTHFFVKFSTNISMIIPKRGLIF